MSKLWGMWFVSRCITGGERDSLSWPAVSGLWLSCTGSWLYILSVKLLKCFCTYPPPRDVFFLSTDDLYEKKNGLDKLPRTSYVWDLHNILKIISTDVAGLATDSSCGVGGVDEPFASYMTQILPNIFPLNLIHSEIAFFILSALYWYFHRRSLCNYIWYNTYPI